MVITWDFAYMAYHATVMWRWSWHPEQQLPTLYILYLSLSIAHVHEAKLWWQSPLHHQVQIAQRGRDLRTVTNKSCGASLHDIWGQHYEISAFWFTPSRSVFGHQFLNLYSAIWFSYCHCMGAAKPHRYVRPSRWLPLFAGKTLFRHARQTPP